MANWTILKDAIANVIKVNGNQEITGQLLQNVLNNIVSSVGENATYGGIAHPNTSPGTPDGPVFWIASEPGAYVNFGNIEIDNIGIFTWDGTSWSFEKLDFIVNDLTTGGKGRALSAEMGKELKKMIDNIDATIDSEDTGLADVTLNIKFSLAQNLTDLTSSVDADTVNFGDSLTVTLTAESGYTVGTCRVTMGGSDITSTAYSNNVVYIAKVTGDVVITAVAAEAGNIPVQFADTAVEAIILANTTHANPSYITEEEALA